MNKNKFIIENFENYNIDLYKKDIDVYGLELVWEEIISNCIEKKSNKLFNIKNFGELYEIGLAHINKKDKKELGKFYTPEDIADLMSNWFISLKGSNICDVCCGTGNLILSYLKLIGKRKTINLLKNKKIYLYDIDNVALNICKYSICLIYGLEYLNNINCINGDFLKKDIVLPPESKVISNPPYFKITHIENTWPNSNVITNSKEFYSAIMEKILQQSKSSVIITPYSFISGAKFYDLRLEMNKHNGFIISFDNVPGNIFNGRKHGIFNSNCTNAVRAAITVTTNKKKKGYQVSPLIRFKNEERKNLLKTEILEKTLPPTFQIVNNENKNYYKCFPKLQFLYDKWNKKSNKKLKELLCKETTTYSLCIPNSCRYFTIASTKDLDRTGKYTLYFKTKEDMDLTYCFLNSSFCYWHWRLYDGGITYTLKLLENLPIYFDYLSKKEKNELFNIAKKMQMEETNNLVYKKNANKMQESIKFPTTYRENINKIFCNALNIENINFSIIHQNSFFGKEENINE